eukprot:snap_masked-scaffold_4-processed-gene-21.26-mRNA-1 protein AED:1.00 eAED:1.00 QI:0/0/0/0/1/1/2/0/322
MISESSSIKANTLPKLGNSKVTYLHWENSVCSFLGKKHAKCYVIYNVRVPALVKVPINKISLEKGVDKVEFPFTREEIRNRIISENLEYNDNEMAVYTPESLNTPTELLRLGLDSTVVVYQNKYVFTLCRTTESFNKMRLAFAISTEEVISILRATVTMELLHSINDQKRTYEAFKDIRKHFEKDVESQKVKSERTISNILFNTLSQYLNEYKREYSRFKLYGGNSSRTMVEHFIRKIPNDQFSTVKFLCQSTFELRFNESQNDTEITEISVNKARINKYRSSKPIRCGQCTGYGHVKKQCPSNEEHCFRCGGTDHKYKNCK